MADDFALGLGDEVDLADLGASLGLFGAASTDTDWGSLDLCTERHAVHRVPAALTRPGGHAKQMLRNALAPPRVAEPGAHDGRVVATMASKVAVNMQLMLLMQHLARTAHHTYHAWTLRAARARWRWRV